MRFLPLLFLFFNFSETVAQCNTTDTIGRALLQLEGNNNVKINRLLVGQDNNRVYAIFQEQSGVTQSSFFIAALDKTSGNVIWCRQWKNASDILCRRLIIVNSDIYVAGFTTDKANIASNNYSLFLARFDTLGNMAWGSNYSISSTFSNNFILLGDLSLYQSGNELLFTMQGMSEETQDPALYALSINTSSIPLWGRIFVNPGWPRFYGNGLQKLGGNQSDLYQLVVEGFPIARTNNFYNISVTQFLGNNGQQLAGASFYPIIVDPPTTNNTDANYNFFDTKLIALNNGQFLAKGADHYNLNTNYRRNFFVQFNQQLQAQQAYILYPPTTSRSYFATTSILPTGMVSLLTDNIDSTFSVSAIQNGQLLNEQKFKKSIGGYTNSSAMALLPNNNYFLMFNNSNGTSTNTELYNQGPLIGADGCGSTLVKESKVMDVPVNTLSFKWDTTLPLNIKPIPLNLSEQSARFTYQSICQTISRCDSLVLVMPDTICAGTTFSVIERKYGTCGKMAQLTASAPFETVAPSIGDSIYTFRYSMPGDYLVQIKYMGCDSYADAKKITIIGNTPIYLPVHDTVLCIGATISVTAPKGYENYRWNGQLPGQQTILISRPGLYRLQADSYCGTTSGDSVWVRLDTSSLRAIPSFTSICKNDTAKILISGNVVDSDIKWRPLQNATIENKVFKAWPVLDTSYTVTAKNTYGCPLTVDVPISVLPLPIIDGLNDIYEVCGFDTSLVIKKTDNLGYLWSNGSTTNMITISDTGRYWLVATDNYHCSTKMDFLIKQGTCFGDLFVPNAFTPNKNGINDFFGAISYGNLQYYSFTVWNRFGQRVFYASDINTKWDARVNGKEQPSGTYIWECRYNFLGRPMQAKKGIVMIIR